jgi:hypothetical protein
MTFDTAQTYVLAASCISRINAATAVTGFVGRRQLYIMEMKQTRSRTDPRAHQFLWDQRRAV